eukprot:365748-Chlamydomonas_euryale.AAC.1
MSAARMGPVGRAPSGELRMSATHALRQSVVAHCLPSSEQVGDKHSIGSCTCMHVICGCPCRRTLACFHVQTLAYLLSLSPPQRPWNVLMAAWKHACTSCARHEMTCACVCVSGCVQGYDRGRGHWPSLSAA